jgi:hypothetical protein
MMQLHFEIGESVSSGEPRGTGHDARPKTGNPFPFNKTAAQNRASMRGLHEEHARNTKRTQIQIAILSS